MELAGLEPALEIIIIIVGRPPALLLAVNPFIRY